MSDASRFSIAVYGGDRADLLPWFRLADDSDVEIGRYRDAGDVLVAVDADRIVGHAQVLHAGTWQLNSIAVAESHRRLGLGRALIEAAIEHVRHRGAGLLEVATGAADTGLLRFYQRLGFRLARIERNAFTPAAGYAPGLTVDGIPLLDRVWLDRTL